MAGHSAVFPRGLRGIPPWSNENAQIGQFCASVNKRAASRSHEPVIQCPRIAGYELGHDRLPDTCVKVATLFDFYVVAGQ
jgi:hypothetical protein